MDNKKRCKWCNLKNAKYIVNAIQVGGYEPWCQINFDDKYLY